LVAFSAKKINLLNKNTILVVSGLPRSGTSLMMQILRQAGIPLLVDDQRTADESNPQGYFEYQPVKKLKTDASWLPLSLGKAVKIVSPLLFYLPDHFEYKIIFMTRQLDEIIVSQNKMLKNQQAFTNEEQAKIRQQLAHHLLQVHQYLVYKKNMQVVKIDFNHLIKNPEAELLRLVQFLGVTISIEKLKTVIKPDLYRSRLENKE